MVITQPQVNQKILGSITALQADLEITEAHAIAQAGSQLQPESQAEFHQTIEATKQLLEQLKSRYI